MANILPIVSPYAGAKGRNAPCYLPYICYDGIDIYIEPFGGCYNIGIQKPKHKIEIYNDSNYKLYLLFKVLSNNGMELLLKMCEVPYSKSFFNFAKKSCDNIENCVKSDLEIAVYVWTLLLQSRNGMMQMFRGIRTGAEEVEFHNAMVEKYPLIDRLKDIITLNENALDLIEKYKNSENVFLMLDPPYIEENYTSKNKRKDIYEKELKKANQHLQLLNIVKDAKAKVLICTYKNKLYDEVLCSNPRWKCIPVVNTYKFMSIGKTGSPKTEATEYIYINYTPESGLNAKK